MLSQAHPRRLVVSALFVALVGAFSPLRAPNDALASTGLPSPTTFNVSGTYTVPASVTQVAILAKGGDGGSGQSLEGWNSSNVPFNEGPAGGGAGGVVQALVAVTPGEVLTITVGQQGSAPAPGSGYAPGGGGGIDGWDTGGATLHGGGGGGSTAVTASGHLIVEAGGGGGGGGYGWWVENTLAGTPGGLGGSGSSAGTGKGTAGTGVPDGGQGGQPDLGALLQGGGGYQGAQASGGGGGGGYRGGGGGTGSPELATGAGGGAGGDSYTDTNLASDVVYAPSSVGLSWAGIGNGTPAPGFATVNPVNSGTPTSPGGPAVAAGSGQISLTWNQPLSTGATPITQYIVTPYLNGVAGSPIPTLSTTTSYTLTAPANGVTYSFTVAAQNAEGLGPSSLQSNRVTPDVLQGPPGTPTVSAGNGQATLEWVPPSPNSGTVQSYVVTGYSSTSTTPLVQNTTDAVPFLTVSGLTNGTTYTFTVAAQNAAGVGAASQRSAPVTPSGVASGANGGIGNFRYGELQTDVAGASGCGANADGEPQVSVAPTGTVLIGSERGLGNGSDAWRAPNSSGGLSASACAPEDAGQPNAVSGAGAAGGDVALAVGSSYDVLGVYPMYVASLNVGSVSVSRSIDDGQTFATVPVQGGVPGDDREWIAAYRGSTSLLTYHDAATSNIDVLRSDDPNLGYLQIARVIPDTDYRAGKNELGSLAIDRQTTYGTGDGTGGFPGFWAYQAFVAPSTSSGTLNNEFFVGVTDDGGFSWSVEPIPCSTNLNDIDHSFPNVSVDPAGNLWAAWSDDSNVYTAVSTDHAGSWHCTGRVSTTTVQAIQPTLVATSSGVDLAYYGSPANSNVWSVYFVQNLTAALSGWGTPQQLVSVHSGAVCEQGLGCMRDRQLYEDFGIDVDASGWAHIAYSHDAATSTCSADLGCPSTYTGYMVQTTGTPVGIHN